MTSIAALQVGNIYHQVVEDVIENVRQVFLDEGLDESLLSDLRSLWLQKLDNHKSVASADQDDREASSSFYPHDSTIPQTDGATDEHVAHDVDHATSTQPISDAVPLIDSQSTFTPAATIPIPTTTTTNQEQLPTTSSAASSSAMIPQLDGGNDDEEDEDWQAGLDSDDEASDSDEPEVIIICAFEKIGRTKNRYKAALKNVILHKDGIDYMFQKATGEWDW
eukprot:m.23762 g.23762  ORF g.23762 m.23762 type:complete len:222 (-) comp14345_c0_seq1:55-720(-)